MKNLRTIILVGAVTLLGVMAYLNIHVHLSLSDSNAPVVVHAVDHESSEVAQNGLSTTAPNAIGSIVPPLPAIRTPAVPTTPAQPLASITPRGNPPKMQQGTFVPVSDLPEHILNPGKEQPTKPATSTPPVPPAARARVAQDPVPSPAAPASGGSELPPGVPGSLKAQSEQSTTLSKEQRTALHDYCADKQDNVIFLTYANFNGSDDKFCRFLESAAQNSIPLTVLNWGGEHRGNGNKLVFTRKAIQQMHPCDVLIFTDAFDVLYAEGPEEIRKKYMSINAPIIVSAECGCWPFIAHKGGNDICLNQFPKSPTDYRYINSGMWGARAYAAEDLLRRIMERNSLNMVQKMSDQEQISTLLLKGEYEWHKDIQIDYYASMFLNMHMADDYGRCDPEKDVIYKDGQLYNKRTQYVPSMYHFNGGSKKRMADAEASMWFKQAKPIKPALTYREVMDYDMKAADRSMNIKPVRVRDMCPGYSGQLLLPRGRMNYFKRGQ